LLWQGFLFFIELKATLLQEAQIESFELLFVPFEQSLSILHYFNLIGSYRLSQGYVHSAIPD